MSRILGALLICVLGAMPTAAQDPSPVPTAKPAPVESTDELAQPIKVVLVLTVMTMAPALLMTVTSFTRILIVLSFVRRAVSVPELPPNQVLVGLSIFLTVVSMRPVLSEIHDQALKPYLDKSITLSAAADKGGATLSKFLLAHAKEEEIRLFLDLTEQPLPEHPDELPLTVLIPAFAISEVKTAFQMGFLIYLPFLILDIVVASVLLSMGMFMLPPVIISTPFKILLFILVDGWDLVVRSLVQSFQA